MAQRHLILGTAGHIDHGKSSLILAMTGEDPDRLAEEKRRGITIELGFAQLDLPDGTRMGVVDVPGHEKFVRQMIAGSTGIDVALLCIAADDGIMPQTREHLSVLQLLGVSTCVVALTKIDLVDQEWVDFMVGEVQEALTNTPYASCEIVPISSRTGEGIEDLKAALARAAQSVVRIDRGNVPRMPVDRSFSIQGAGTVVTGTLWAGELHVGDELEILPRGTVAGVRGLQEHGCAVDKAQAGERVAVNLRGVKTSDVRPGDFLASPHTLQATDRFDAWLTYVEWGETHGSKPLATGTRVHVAHGTREVIGRVLLMDGKPELACGKAAFAQIRLDEPLPVTWRDHFVIRSYSPVRVVGGGMVLKAHPRRRTTLAPGEEDLLCALRAEDASGAARCAAMLQQHLFGIRGIVQACGCSDAQAREAVEGLVSAKKLVRLDDGDEAYYAQRSVLAREVSAVENALLAFHAENPAEAGISCDQLARRLGKAIDARTAGVLVQEACRARRAVMVGDKVCHPSAQAGIQAAHDQAKRTVTAALDAAGATPPALDEVLAQAGIQAALGRRVALEAAQEGSLVRIAKDLFYAKEPYDALRNAAVAHLREHGASSAADIKDAMGVSRKFAMPLLEHFDAEGITVREGDLRRLA